MNSKIYHDTLVGISEYFQKHQHLLLSIVEFTIFYIAKVRFSGILSHPFWYKSHFFEQRKDEFENLSGYTCWHTKVLSKTPAPVALHRRAYHILHCKVRFSRILSHPFWYKSHFFDQRKDEFEDLSRYTCWHIRVLSKTPAPVALHRRAYHILHCKGAIFRNFEPSLLIQKSFFLTRENMNSKICHDTLVGIPEYFRKYQHLLLSIVELAIFYITKLRFSRILSHPFLIQKSFFWPEKRWIRKSVTIHLLAYQSTFKNTSTCFSPS